MTLAQALNYLNEQRAPLAANAGSPKARWYILANGIATQLALYNQAVARSYGIVYAAERIVEAADSWQMAMENEIKLNERGW